MTILKIGPFSDPTRTYRVVGLEVEQVDRAALALQHLTGLRDDGGNEPFQAHLFLEQTPGQGEQELEHGTRVFFHFMEQTYLLKSAPFERAPVYELRLRKEYSRA